MVDPNRKINRLTEKDIEFLEECEQEFSSRYTDDDHSFMEHCSKPLDDPPIMENWNSGSGDFSRNESDSRYQHRVGNRNPRNWHNYRHRRAASDYNSGGRRPYEKFPRNYSNFVAASTND